MNYLVNLNLNKNELQNAVVQPLATDPGSPKAGQIYFNSTTKKLNIYNGTTWVPVGTDPPIETIKVNGSTLTPVNKVVDITAIPLSIVTGAGDAAYKGVVTSVDTSASLPTSGAVKTYVDGAIADLPEPMIFKGSVGTDGTVTWVNLPAAAASNEGFTYKVITAHTAETGKPAAEVGDTIISTGSEWVVIPSGDEPKGTVTSVGISNSGLITISGSPITSSGSITIGHGTPSGATAIGTAGFYKIKTDAYGHVNGTTAVVKSDITSLVGNATESVDGLMSAEDKTTLDNLEAASQGAITYTSLTIAQGQTSVNATGIASKLITFQAYQGGEAVVVDYDGSAFSVAAAATSAITIKCIVTV